MSDHAWAQDQIAAYAMGGLTAEETDRAERHFRDCHECAAALSTARRLDRSLQSLFVDVRPGLELEDEAVRSTRTARTRRFAVTNWIPRLAVAAALLLALGMVGALANALVIDGQLPMPGYAVKMKEGNEKAIRRDGLVDALTEKVQGVIAGKDEAARTNTELERSHGDQPATGQKGAEDAPSWATKLIDRVPQFGGGQSPQSQGMPAGISGFNGVGGGPGGFGGGISSQSANLGFRQQPNGINGGISGISGGIGGGISGGIGGGISGGDQSGFGGGIGGGTPPSGSTIIGGAQDPVRGTPFSLRPLANSDSLPGPVFFGGYPKPVQIMPVAPTNPTGSGSGSLPFNSAGAPSSFRPSEHPVAPIAEDPVMTRIVKGRREGDRRQPPAEAPSDADAGPRRVIIRSGDIEFEVTSFDDATAIVTKLVSGLNGAFVVTVNSEKLASGKVRGAITVRTPPEHLDRFVLDLRRELGAAGELKGMKIGSQDITKQYTDLESRLRAARAMEQRLIQLIKDGKGEIKELLAAEKELGVWRTKIEEVEGEIRYYANLAALATLTVTLAEKEVRAAATISENERVQAGVEVEDVDKAYQQTLLAVAEAKGRVAKSELKQLSAGQFNASLQFEVPPDAAGPLRDRLRQLGRVARLEIDRVQQAVTGTPPTDAKVKRGDTLFLVQIYNLANVAARETATLQVAVPDVRAGYQALRDAASKTTGRVLTAQLNEQDAQNVSAQFDFEVRRADEGAIRAALDAAGEAVSRQVIRAPEGIDSTDSKVLFRVTLLATSRLSPRETTTLTLEVQDVDQALSAFAAQIAEAKGRQLGAQSTRDQSGKVLGRAVFEVPMAAAGILERLKSVGTVRVHQSTRDAYAPAGKYATARFDITLVNRDQIVAEDDGLWPQVRRGLSYSVAVLLTSVTWVVFGLCVVLPWAVAIYACYRLYRRFGRPSRPLSPAPG